MTTPSVTTDAIRQTIRGTSYSLSWRQGPNGFVRSPYLELVDADGARWARLSALCSVHTRAVADETLSIAEPEVLAASDAVLVSIRSESSCWDERVLELRCTAETVEITVRVSGQGELADATLLGGDGVLPTGAAGTFRSHLDAQSVYVPTPTEPVAFVRPAWAAASLGVVGDADPGRLHGIFSPPPLAFAFGRPTADDPLVPGDGAWLAVWLRAPVEALRFTTFRHEPLDGGTLLRLAYEGHTLVDGTWHSPTLVLRPVASASAALSEYRTDLIAAGAATDTGPIVHPWWLEPIFCGWGAQVARGGAPAPDLCRQGIYDDFLATMDAASLDPGTIVIDDRWQAQYGTGDIDTDAWPDLRGWIARQHDRGRRVLLWWKVWDPTGLPVDECITDAAGRPRAADPGSPAYLQRVDAIVDQLLGANGLNADGFKVDFTQRTPSGATLRSAAKSDGVWGIAALHRLVGRLHSAATAIKPDALVITHTVHPSFGDVAGMIRTNDVLENDTAGRLVSVAAQLRARHAIVTATLPKHPIDTDQWPMPSRAQWLDYARAQVSLGVPALYYVERVRNDEPITADDLAEVARTWTEYRNRPA